MAKLAYYASQIPGKPHQFITQEGYRIYTAVPICRTGFQEYLGAELKGHPDYDPAWGFQDDDVIRVYRPLDVVTARETIASFEGKTVVDGHPPDEVALVTAENEQEYSRGHMQNLRTGEPLSDGEAAGETPLLADLWVKHQGLNDKIDGGVRDVSCGYVFSMKRADDGRIVMTKISGNHVAVVPKGRAGPEVSIRDAKPAALAAESTTKQKARKPVSLNNNSLFGRMLKAFAKDAEPEEVAEAAKLAGDAEENPFEKKEGVNYDTDFYWDAANQKAVPIRNSKGYSKRKAGDAEEMVEELHPDLKQHMADTKAALDAIAAHLGVGKANDAPVEEEVVDPAAGDADVLEMEESEQGKSDLPKQIGDADTVDALVALRPKIVAAKDAAITKAYNARVREVKKSAAASDSAYAALATPAGPDVATGVVDVDPMRFFNGVSYSEGLRRYNEHMAAQAAKKGRK